jgi:hypothetical protein
MLLFAEAALVHIGGAVLPTLWTYKTFWTLLCVTHQCRFPREFRRSYYIASWSRMYAQNLLRHEQLMQPNPSALTTMPSRFTIRTATRQAPCHNGLRSGGVLFAVTILWLCLASSPNRLRM